MKNHPAQFLRTLFPRRRQMVGGLLLAILLLFVAAEVLAHPLFAVRPLSPPNPVAGRENTFQTKLKLGETIRRQIAGGEVHTYSIRLKAGEYLNAAADDGKFDAIFSLLDAAGKVLRAVDYTTGRRDLRRIIFIAEQDGEYRLQIRQAEETNAASEYTIKIEELRAATEQDKTNIKAEQTFGGASRLSVEDDGNAKLRAVAKYEEALSLFRKNADRWGEARTLIKLGELLASELSDFKRALEYDEQALPIWRELKDRAEEGFTLSEIGFCANNLGDTQKALDFNYQSLAIRREVKDVGGEAVTLNNIGTIYSGLGNQEKAIEFYLQSLPLRRAVFDTGGEAATLGNIATAYGFLGDPNKAIEFYKQELPLERAAKSVAGEAFALANLGNTYYGVGERQIALDYVNQSLQLARKIGDRGLESSSLNILGVIYASLGEYEQALEMYKLSAQIRHDTGNKRYEAVTLTNAGNAYFRQKNYAKALESYNQSLALSRAVNSPIVESQTLNVIGNLFYETGDRKSALKYQTDALAIAERINSSIAESRIENSLGIIFRDTSETAKAEAAFNRSLELTRARREGVSEAATLYHYALLEQSRGDLDAALKRIEAAISIVENLRGSVASQNLRTSYMATVQDYYRLRTEILMRLDKARPNGNFAALALESAEKTRARSLLDLLAESRADIRQGVDAALLEKEKTLRQTLAAKASVQTRLLIGKHVPQQEAAVAAEIKKLSDEYERTQAQIRLQSPRYAALTQLAAVSVKDLQSRILDRDTLLLEYAFGDERSFLWIVGQDSVKNFLLPKRAEIETAARRVYEILTVRNQNLTGENDTQKRARVERAERDFAEASASLSRIVLPPEAAAELKNKRLAVVADGALQYVPFAALQVQSPKSKVQSFKNSGQKTNGAVRYLIETNEIVNLPSASTLAVLRAEKRAASIDNSIAIVADPVFSADDVRVSEYGKAHKKSLADSPQTVAARNANPTSVTTPSIERAARETGFDNFPRLRFSRDEAEGISAIAPRGNLMEAVDFAANKKTVAGADFGKHRIIHFATHGLIDSQNPELSGVVLSLVDENGDAQDGFLHLFEIYNLKLESDLVVLSACRTALGKDVRGEGLIGLTRGFMYAGAPRVVASLWSIDDRATAELMKRFYASMLKEKMPAAKALRAAQIEMLQNPRWRNPYYWAAFTLQGEWR